MLRPCAAVVRAAVALADAAWRVVRAAVVRRRRAVLVLGDFLAAVEREPVLRVPVLRELELLRAAERVPVLRVDVLREVERVPVDLRVVDGLRVVVERRAAGLRAVLVEPEVEVAVVVLPAVLVVLSAMSALSAPLWVWGSLFVSVR